jgi:Methyltransferase domain
MVDNVEVDWVTDTEYDFIHSRAMFLTIRDWPRLFEQAYKYVLLFVKMRMELIRHLCSRHLKPGGYLELQDLCLPVRSDDPVHASNSKAIQYTKYIMEAGTLSGMNFQAPLLWDEQLRAAGFTDIYLQWYNWPFGTWAKHPKNKIIGRYVLADVSDVIEAGTAFFTRVLGWRNEDVATLISEVRNELKEMKMNLYQRVCFCYARKPEVPES